jgi:hypothetical protein
MAEYPEAEVDRIIADEVRRQEETGKYARARARERIALLFAGRLHAWQQERGRRTLERLAAADRGLMEFTAQGTVFPLNAESFHRVFLIFCDCDESMGAVLGLYHEWPEPSIAGTRERTAELIGGLLESLAVGRDTMRRVIEFDGVISLHVNVFEDYHDALMVASAALMTPSEGVEYQNHLDRALVQLVASKRFFFPQVPGKPTVH